MGLVYFRHLQPLGHMTSRQRSVGALLALLALTLLPAPVLAQVGSDTATAQAQAGIVRPGTIVRLTDMDFGIIAQPTAPGTVVLTPAAAPACNTTGGLVHTGACQAASYAGDMTFFFLLRITKPVGGQINLVGPGGATMRLNNFSFGGTTGLFNWGSTAAEQRYLVTSGDGRFSFHLGGTLQVAANQAPGAYTGTYTLQFNYQ